MSDDSEKMAWYFGFDLDGKHYMCRLDGEIASDTDDDDATRKLGASVQTAGIGEWDVEIFEHGVTITSQWSTYISYNVEQTEVGEA